MTLSKETSSTCSRVWRINEWVRKKSESSIFFPYSEAQKWKIKQRYQNSQGRLPGKVKVIVKTHRMTRVLFGMQDCIQISLNSKRSDFTGSGRDVSRKQALSLNTLRWQGTTPQMRTINCYHSFPPLTSCSGKNSLGAGNHSLNPMLPTFHGSSYHPPLSCPPSLTQFSPQGLLPDQDSWVKDTWLRCHL